MHLECAVCIKQWRVNPTYQRTKQQVVFVHAEDTAVSLSIPQIFAFDCGKILYL